MNFNNRTYDILKYITTIVLPALGTLYFALSSIWGLPYGEQIVGTITAVVTFFGVCLRISNTNYLAEKEQDNFNSDDYDELYEVEDYETEIDATEE